MVTSMGREEEYKQGIVAQLKARNITPHGKESIKQLEEKLKRAMEK